MQAQEYEPIHSEVWRKLEELQEELFKKDQRIQQLKRANSKQKNTIRRIVRERDALLEQSRKEKKPHYRNGRKRGRTMNG